MPAAMSAAICAFALATLGQPAPTPPSVADHAIREKQRLRILIMDLAAEGVEPGTVKTLTGIVSAELAAYPDLDVMADADVRRILDLEGEKQSVGCGDTSCLADIAGAMGARLVVFGSVGKLGDTLVLHLNLYDSQKAQSVGRQFLEAKDVATLPRLLQPKLRALLERTYNDQGLTLPAEATTATTTERSPLVPAVFIGGGAVGIIGGVAALYFGTDPYFIYQAQLGRFKDAEAAGDVSTAAELRDNSAAQAEAWNNYGLALSVTGGALVVAGLVAAAVGTVELLAGDD